MSAKWCKQTLETKIFFIVVHSDFERASGGRIVFEGLACTKRSGGKGGHERSALSNSLLPGEPVCSFTYITIEGYCSS